MRTQFSLATSSFGTVTAPPCYLLVILADSDSCGAASVVFVVRSVPRHRLAGPPLFRSFSSCVPKHLEKENKCKRICAIEPKCTRCRMPRRRPPPCPPPLRTQDPRQAYATVLYRGSAQQQAATLTRVRQWHGRGPVATHSC